MYIVNEHDTPHDSWKSPSYKTSAHVILDSVTISIYLP